MEGRNIFTVHSQYHGCWSPGDSRSQGISSICIDIGLLQFFPKPQNWWVQCQASFAKKWKPSVLIWTAFGNNCHNRRIYCLQSNILIALASSGWIIFWNYQNNFVLAKMAFWCRIWCAVWLNLVHGWAIEALRHEQNGRILQMISFVISFLFRWSLYLMNRKYKDYVHGRRQHRSTRKNKEYLRSKDKAKKMTWCIKTYITAYVKTQKMKTHYPACQTHSPTSV